MNKILSLYDNIDAYKLGEAPKNKIIRLHLNESLFTIPKEIVNSVILRESDIHSYPDDTDIDTTLKQSLSSYSDIPPDSILISNGSDNALKLCVDTIVERDDNVLVFLPTYTHFLQFLSIKGANIVQLYIKDITIDTVIANIEKHRPVVVYICSPNNPCGYIWEPSTVELLSSRFPNSFFIVDEAYYEFGGKSCSALVKKHDNIIVTRTFSKSFGLAGLRIGYLISNTKLINIFNNLYNPKNVLTISKKAAILCLTRYIDSFKDNINIVMHCKKILSNSLYLVPNIEDVVNKGGNFVLIKSSMDSKELCSEFEKEGIIVRDRGYIETLEKYIRVSVNDLTCTYNMFNAMLNIMNKAVVSKCNHAVILAAGMGTRMGIDKPKCMIKINGVTIIERQLTILNNLGINNITVVTGYKREIIENLVKNKYGVKCIYNEDYEKYNNWKSLLIGIKNVNDNTIIIDGDLVFNKRILESLLKCNDESCMVIDSNKIYSDESMRVSVENAYINSISKKYPNSYGEYIGIARINNKNLDCLRDSLENSADDDYYDTHIVKSVKCRVLDTFGFEWIEVDTRDDCDEMMDMFL